MTKTTKKFDLSVDELRNLSDSQVHGGLDTDLCTQADCSKPPAETVEFSNCGPLTLGCSLAPGSVLRTDDCIRTAVRCR